MAQSNWQTQWNSYGDLERDKSNREFDLRNHPEYFGLDSNDSKKSSSSSGSGGGSVVGKAPEYTLKPTKKTSVSTTDFIGPTPTAGEMAKFTLPTRGATPEFNMPEMGDIPTFEAPLYDEGKISKMAQQNAAPGVRNLRTAVQAVTSRRSDNPNVDRMTLRDALAGYGQGLEEVMSGARQTASAEYAQKYAMEYKTAGMNWETAVQTVRDKFAGQMEGRKMEFQAEMDAVNQVYSASVLAESQRVAAENQRTMSIFDAAMQKYLAGATKTAVEEQKYDLIKSKPGWGVQPSGGGINIHGGGINIH